MQPLYVIIYLMNLYEVEYRILPQVLVVHFALSTLTLGLGFSGGYGFC